MKYRQDADKYPEKRAVLKPLRCKRCRKPYLQGEVVETLVDCPHCGETNYIDNSHRFAKIATN
jgi:phage FluMu protein Com